MRRWLIARVSVPLLVSVTACVASPNAGATDLSSHLPTVGAALRPDPTRPGAAGLLDVTTADGAVFRVVDGSRSELGDAAGLALRAPIVDLAGYALGNRGSGYYLAAADGGVFSFAEPSGTAASAFHGSAATLPLRAPVTAITASGGRSGGYRLAATDGGVFAFGDAAFYGSAAKLALRAPIVDMAWYPDGYWLAAADGGVFAYGDAPFDGSAADLQLRAPIVAISWILDDRVTHVVPRGYLLVAADGGVFAFGGAAFHGSAAELDLDAPIVDFLNYGNAGYRLIGADGAVYPFGNIAPLR